MPRVSKSALRFVSMVRIADACVFSDHGAGSNMNFGIGNYVNTAGQDHTVSDSNHTLLLGF
jgi:hypothetical protein